MKASGLVECLTVSEDNKFIASGDQGNVVTIWSKSGRKQIVYRGHTSWVYDVEFVPNLSFVASGSRDNSVHIWSINQAPAHRL
jgi:WD40 repeat protein